MNDSIEKEIQLKGLNAPRVTMELIEAQIRSQHFFTAGAAIAALGQPTDPNSPTDQLTFCVLVMNNGFTVTGESACASPENFDAELGRKIARQNAVSKLWSLLGYELRTKLTRAHAEQERLKIAENPHEG